MAASIAVSVPVSASPETIFAALTESAGLASFWTTDCHAEPVVGSVTRVNIRNGTRLQLRVDELEPGRRVVWAPLTNVSRPPRWTGTTVTWSLVEAGDGQTSV